MKPWLRYGAFALAAAFLILTLVNASWLAPDPVGAPKLIAHRGLSQLYDKAGVERDTCTADRIEQPVHGYLENTIDSVLRAQQLGAWAVEVDLAPTADGELVVFHDWTLDCRTEGTGDVRDATLEELKALDPGYGYTADGGKSFPFRGKFKGVIPTFEELVQALPPRGRLMINFKSKNPAEADLVSARLAAIGRDPAASGDGFYGHAGPINRIRALHPGAWAWEQAAAKQCSQDYVTYGWTGYLPESCRGGTLIVPLNYQWSFWGWPNRLIARMEAHGGRVLVVGPIGDNRPRGLDLPEQLGDVPASFNGYVWVEDGWAILPALYPRFDTRTPEETERLEAGLERRRERYGD